MGKRRIWLITAMFIAIEAFVFPELLYPDCIRVKSEQIYDWTAWSGQTEQQDFEWKSWILSLLSR